MSQSTTALLRRIEAEKEQKRQDAWADRSERRIRNPKWAVDHLMDAGQIGPALHEAAHRYASALERSQPGGAGGIERVDGASIDPHARLWDAAVCSSVVRAGRLFVLRARSTAKHRMQVMDRLFAYDGAALTGARPTMALMQRSPSGSKLPYGYAVRRIAHVLELLDVFWTDRDRGFGR